MIPVELAPGWARSDPVRLDLARVGVRYAVSPAAAGEVLSKLEPAAAVAACGSAIWIDGGRPTDYDPDHLDEVRDCLVRERPWPICWGDLVVFVGALHQLRVVVAFDAGEELAWVLLVSERERRPSIDLALLELEHIEPDHAERAVDLPPVAWSPIARPAPR